MDSRAKQREGEAADAAGDTASTGSGRAERHDAGDVTRLLAAARAGDTDAVDRLVPRLYSELRGLARRQLARERAGHTLQATALVHEAYMKLVGPGQPDWQDRAHFLAVAARAMRQVLVDHARRRDAAKRGGDWQRTSLGHNQPAEDARFDELVALDRALDALDEVDPRARQVVEFRYFAGMTGEEIGEVLGLSSRTVERDWVRARAWLYKELYPHD